jgi:protocatechuate 3,4-dioxygenase beta subunit
MIIEGKITRRDVVRVGSVIFASGAVSSLQAFLAGCGGTKAASTTTTTTTTTTTSSTSTCEEATNVTRGPYFVDNQVDANITNDVVDTTLPERSDIRTDSKRSGGTQAGLTLTLTLNVGSYSSSGCTELSGAQVDIWHCNAQGVYSDIKNATNGGGVDYTGENFLRGYQLTDANGQVTFTTIYPGWYSGRTPHIHVKVRVYNSKGVITTEATTQLFFSDPISNAVYAANSAYSRSVSRDTMNTTDSVFAAESPDLLVSLTGSATTSYAGTVSIGIQQGVLYGG